MQAQKKDTPGTASDLAAGLQLGEHVDLAVAIGHAFHGFNELAVLKRFQALVDLARVYQSRRRRLVSDSNAPQSVTMPLIQRECPRTCGCCKLLCALRSFVQMPGKAEHHNYKTTKDVCRWSLPERGAPLLLALWISWNTLRSS